MLKQAYVLLLRLRAATVRGVSGAGGTGDVSPLSSNTGMATMTDTRACVYQCGYVCVCGCTLMKTHSGLFKMAAKVCLQGN